MAIPPPEFLRTLTIDDFKTEYVYKNTFMEDYFPKCKTVSDVERDVAKLKSVSKAGRAWIVDERCSWLSIGRHANTFRLKMK